MSGCNRWGYDDEDHPMSDIDEALEALDEIYKGIGYESLEAEYSQEFKKVRQALERQRVPGEWRAAVQEFVDRCERGEVLSKYTYKKFKALLAAAPEPDDG